MWITDSIMYIFIFLLFIQLIHTWPTLDSDIRGLFLSHELASKALCTNSTKKDFIKICNKCSKIVNYRANLSLSVFELKVSAYAYDVINKNINDVINYSDGIPPVILTEIDKLSKTIETLNSMDTIHAKNLVDAVKNFTLLVNNYAKDRIAYEKDYLKNSNITTIPIAVLKLLNLGNAYTTLGLASLADLMGRKSCQSLTQIADQLCINAYNATTMGNKSSAIKSVNQYRGTIADEMDIITRIIINQTKEVEDINDDAIFEISKLANMEMLRKILPPLMNILHIDTKPSLEMFIKEYNYVDGVISVRTSTSTINDMSEQNEANSIILDYNICIPDLHCPCGTNDSISSDCWYESYKKHEYDLPNWLKNYDLECPFERCNLYKGTHGITSYIFTGNIEDPLVNLYGHGLSSSPKYKYYSKNYSLEFFANQIRELLVFLKLDAKPSTLLGVSMGCCIAAKYCQMYPNSVDKLIFLSPAGHITNIPLKIKAIKKCSCVTPMVGCFFWPICFKRRMYRKSSLWERMIWLLFVKKRGPSGIMACVNRLPLWNCLDLYQDIGKLNKPTLLVWGKCDNLIPIKISDDFQKALNNSLLISFDNCGHLVLSDKPMETICTCIAFLNLKISESQINIQQFRNWLPFDQNGNYIYKIDRFIDGTYDSNDMPKQILVTLQEYECNIN